MTAHFIFEYRLTMPFGTPRHCWTCIGRHGAMHLHISGPHHYDGRENWSAGLETHHRQPPEHMEDDAPSHEKCWLIGGPCWHDGTSLYASEQLLPEWQRKPHDHAAMFELLQIEYAKRFPVARAIATIDPGTTDD